MVAEGPTLLQRGHKLLGEVNLVSDITVLVTLIRLSTDRVSSCDLLRAGQVKLGHQVDDDLQLKQLDCLSQDVRCNPRNMLTGLTHEPQDAG